MRQVRMWTLLAVLLVAAGAVRAQRNGLPAAIAGEIPRGSSAPAGTFEPVRTWSANDAIASHKSGHTTADSEGSGGKAWEAITLHDTPDDAMLYGPYVELPAGDYVAFFRLKLMEEAGNEEVATVDAVSGMGLSNLAIRRLRGVDLAVGRYVEIPLGFHYVAGKLECRLMWTGYAGLRIDRVDLYRLIGGKVESGVPMTPQPVSSGRPKGLTPVRETRPFAELFPRSKPPTPTLAIFAADKYPADWRLAIYALQGLVNRSQPRLYVLSNSEDPFWLARMKEKGWIKATNTIADPRALLRAYRSSYKGLIITDAAVPASKNVATMLASLDDALPVSPRLAKELDAPVLQDLRGRWKTNGEAYQWAFDHLWPRLNHHVTACLYPESSVLRDYLVANRIFIYWLPGRIDGARDGGDPNSDVAAIERMMAKFPVNTPMMGFPWAGKDVGIGEGGGITLMAEFGHYLVGSDNLSNVTVHSGLRLPAPKQKPAPPVPALDPGKVYVTFLMSDGDNLPVLEVGNFPQLWRDPLRGTFPIAWTASPSASMLLPDVVDYYYSTATPNDTFVAAVSGVGYTYPDYYAKRYKGSAGLFDEFLDITRTHMAEMDQHQSWIMNATRPEIIRRYAEKMPNLLAIWPDYGRVVQDYAHAVYPSAHNIPVFRALAQWREDDNHAQKVAYLVEQVRRLTPATRPAFMNLFIWNWGAELSVYQEALKELGPDYVPVRPDHLAALYRRNIAQDGFVAIAPSGISTMEGVPATIEVQVQNTAAQRRSIGFSVGSGLTGARVTGLPDKAVPGVPYTVTVAGVPDGRPVTIRVASGAVSKHYTVSVQRIRRAEVLGELPAGGRLRLAAHYDAVGMAHGTGVAQTPTADGGGEAWVARAGVDKPGHVIYGPYASLAPGRYIALFHMKRLGDGAGTVLDLDTCVAGGVAVTGKRAVTAAELPAGEYRWVAVPFAHPGGSYETRALWNGAASVEIDSVDVWQVTGE